MIVEGILSRLDRVRRSGRGFRARCPSHDDRNPSLSVHEGARGVLIKCWAGCDLDEICAALGIQKRDLFFDERPDPVKIRATKHRRKVKEAIRSAELSRPAIYREAEAITKAVTIPDVTRLADAELDKAVDIVCDAWNLLIRERNDGWTRKSVAG